MNFVYYTGSITYKLCEHWVQYGLRSHTDWINLGNAQTHLHSGCVNIDWVLRGLITHIAGECKILCGGNLYNIKSARSFGKKYFSRNNGPKLKISESSLLQ